jgi:hypothetical protein
MPLVTQSKCFFLFFLISHARSTRRPGARLGFPAAPVAPSRRPANRAPPNRCLLDRRYNFSDRLGTRDAQLVRPPGRAAGTTPPTVRRPRSSCASKSSSGCASPPPLRYTRDPRLLRQRAADRAPRTRRSSERRRPVQIQAVTPI